MFCSECGVNASGKFCHACGSRLHTADAAAQQPAPIPVSQTLDWEHDVRYETIVGIAAVRDTIASHAAGASKGISGEAILAVYDQIIASPVPLASLVAVAQPFYDSLGIRTGKQRNELVATPIGRTIAQTLCSLAKEGQTLENVDQHTTGCELTAQLPSSVCALRGQLTISLLQHGHATRVAAATVIPGQMYDWGKSRRCLDQLLADLKSDLGLPTTAARRAA